MVGVVSGEQKRNRPVTAGSFYCLFARKRKKQVMIGKLIARNRKNHGGALRAERGQAMVEFAITLPVLLMLLIGLMEVGRMLFMYASVVNSSRDAVRYASAYGRSDDLGDGNLLKYKYCDGIAATAKASGFFLRLQDTDITITYDTGPGGTSLGSCPPATTTGEANINVETGDRVTVSVRATYNPMLSLLPLGTRTFTATSSRTILGVHELDN
jgi:Flp pilus assembly protein TadG